MQVIVWVYHTHGVQGASCVPGTPGKLASQWNYTVGALLPEGHLDVCCCKWSGKCLKGGDNWSLVSCVGGRMTLIIGRLFSSTILLVGWCNGTCVVVFCQPIPILYRMGHCSCVLSGDPR